MIRIIFCPWPLDPFQINFCEQGSMSRLGVVTIDSLVQDRAHTSPVNDQLPLLIGQLEKQSGRSIARIGGEKGKKLCVVWWGCKLLHHTVMLLESSPKIRPSFANEVYT